MNKHAGCNPELAFAVGHTPHVFFLIETDALQESLCPS